MQDGNGRQAGGRFANGHKFARGRPKGARNKLHLRDVPGIQANKLQRFRDLAASIVNDLGGQDMLSVGQIQIARRCALLSVECERMERNALKGGPFDANLYSTIAVRLSTLFEKIGFEKRPRDVTLSLAQYLAMAQPLAHEQDEVEPEDACPR